VTCAAAAALDRALALPRLFRAGRSLELGIWSATGGWSCGAEQYFRTLDLSAAQIQYRARVGLFELNGIRAASKQFIADQLNSRFEAPGDVPGRRTARSHLGGDELLGTARFRPACRAPGVETVPKHAYGFSDELF